MTPDADSIRHTLNAEFHQSFVDNELSFHVRRSRDTFNGTMWQFAIITACATAVSALGLASTQRLLPAALGVFAATTAAGGWLSGKLAALQPGEHRRYTLPFRYMLDLHGVSYRHVDHGPTKPIEYAMTHTKAFWRLSREQ